MRHLILEKIAKVLNSEIGTEAKTLYLLAEIRKVLNLDKKYPPNLSIFCNWALHSELNHNNTREYFLRKFESYIDNVTTGQKMAEKILSNQANFFKLNELKIDLEEFLKENNLPQNLTNTSSQWTGFIKLLLEILKECQITFDGDKIKKLSIIEDKNGKICYRLHLKNRSISKKNILKIKLTIGKH